MAIVPVLPDVLGAACTLLEGQTDAGTAVLPLYADAKRPTPYRRPHIFVEREGGMQVPEDNRMARARLIFTAKGRSWAETRRITAQIHDVFLPPDDVAGGLYALVGDTRFLGAREDSPPRESPDERNLPESVSSYETMYVKEGI